MSGATGENTLLIRFGSAINARRASRSIEPWHEFAVAEFPLDFSAPGDITLSYPRKPGGVWNRIDDTGAKQMLQWRGTLKVTVVK